MNSERPVYIYALIDPRDGRPRYIGKTVDPEVRLQGHLHDAAIDARVARNDRAYWLRELLDTGFSPRMEILIETTEGEWEATEQLIILAMRRAGEELTNVRLGGAKNRPVWVTPAPESVTPAMLTSRRKALGLTQTALGQLLGAPQETISRWESGDLSIERPETLDLALRYLESVTDDFRRRLMAYQLSGGEHVTDCTDPAIVGYGEPGGLVKREEQTR